jgi:hypothetical protein
MTKLYNEVPQLNLQCLHVDDKMFIVYFWINFVIHASTSIFAFKWHIINLMKEGKKEKRRRMETRRSKNNKLKKQ